jgi:lipopolysaccharide export system protein LptC
MLAKTMPEPHLGHAPDDRDDPKTQAFAVAQRHSRRVRILKFAFPILAAVLAGGFLLVSYVMTPVQIAVQAEGSAFVDGKLVMANPKLEGVTKDSRPYAMTAQRAIQDLKTPNVIELEAISAKLPIDVDQWVSIDAPKGIYDRDANTLDVKSAFKVKSTEGLSAAFNSAFVDMAKGSLTTTDPVDITINGTRVQAESMTVAEKGKVFVFEKRVRMEIDPAQLNKIRAGNGG